MRHVAVPSRRPHDGRGLSAGYRSKPEPSPARLRSDSFKSCVTNGRTPSWLATSRITGPPVVDRVIPARVRKGEGRPKISTFPGSHAVPATRLFRSGTEINLRYTRDCLEGLRPATWPPIKLPLL